MKKAIDIGHEELVKNVMLLQASVKQLEIKNNLLSEECAIQSRMLQQLTTLQESKSRLNLREHQKGLREHYAGNNIHYPRL